jgi:FdhE protein
VKLDRWDARRRRARELADRHPSAAEALEFFDRITTAQQKLYEQSPARGNGHRDAAPGSLRAELPTAPLLSRFGAFLAVVADAAPRPLAAALAELNAAGPARWEDVLLEYWQAGGGTELRLGPAEALAAWLFLQPYAESLADQRPPLPPDQTPSRCPRCSFPPQVGVLRPEGDGGRRFLVCALCATEWPFRRLLCAACGEEQVDRLPVYTSEAFPQVRVEACDTCRHYIKTVDLTKDGHAVPVVDELAAIPLSLWAAEHDYTKLSGNLLGL